jgi:hypothetical protein
MTRLAIPAAPPPGPQLRDIHLPPSPSWWPPAPGWWLLAAVAVIALAVLLGWTRRRMQRRALRRRWLAEIDALVGRHATQARADELAAGLHQLLRRAARTLDAGAVQQRGTAWRETLARVPVAPATLDRLLALDAAIYRPASSFDRDASLQAVRSWLSAWVDAQPAGRSNGPARPGQRSVRRA